MKKALCLLLGIMLMLAMLTACGQTENPTNPTTTTESITTTTKPTTTEPTTTNPSVQGLEIGYWYFCNPDDLPDDQRVFVNGSELHIKSIEGNVVTFDLVERKLWDLKDVQVKFNGKEGKGVVDGEEITMFVRDRDAYGTGKYHIEIEYCEKHDGTEFVTPISIFFDYKSDTPITEELKVEPAQNYDLNSYKGMWFQTEDEMNDWKYSTWTYGYLDIKSVDGNKVTFDYHYIQLCGEADIVVEINNNVGFFIAHWTVGIIRFEEDCVKLIVSDVHYGPEPHEGETKYVYRAAYSEKL